MAFGQKEEMSQKIALENNNSKNDVGYAINYLCVRFDNFLEVIILYRLNIEVFF